MLPYIVLDPTGEHIATLKHPDDVACMLAYHGTGCAVLRATDNAVVWASTDVVPDVDDVNLTFANEIATRYAKANNANHHRSH